MDQVIRRDKIKVEEKPDYNIIRFRPGKVSVHRPYHHDGMYVNKDTANDK